MTILVVDVGGSNVKLRLSGQRQVRRFPSGPELTARQLVAGVMRMTKGWPYSRVSIGYPGPVSRGRMLAEPKNLGRGWVGFDFKKAFGCPVALINDAAMQALGSYEGGRMLFLGLGTGLGSALIEHNTIMPMELGHLPYKKKKTFEDYVGRRGLERLSKRKWRRAVDDVVARLKDALVADHVVVGGGNVKKLARLPAGSRRGDNTHAFLGGERLWEEPWCQDMKTGRPSRSSAIP
jgi:predicted NBD/HSP70 family sugar kinase